MAQLIDEDIIKYIPYDCLDMIEIFLNSDSHSYTMLSLSADIVNKYRQEIIDEITRIKWLFLL